MTDDIARGVALLRCVSVSGPLRAGSASQPALQAEGARAQGRVRGVAEGSARGVGVRSGPDAPSSLGAPAKGTEPLRAAALPALNPFSSS